MTREMQSSSSYDVIKICNARIVVAMGNQPVVAVIIYSRWDGNSVWGRPGVAVVPGI